MGGLQRGAGAGRLLLLPRRLRRPAGARPVAVGLVGRRVGARGGRPRVRARAAPLVQGRRRGPELPPPRRDVGAAHEDLQEALRRRQDPRPSPRPPGATAPLPRRRRAGGDASLPRGLPARAGQAIASMNGVCSA